MVARTRLIDDAIAAVLDNGIEQLVILGAGFDSRAYRMSRLRALDVFEVDHPDTQAAKQGVLKRVFSTLPTHVRFVAIDFKRDDLTSAMRSAGYRDSARTFILWEGVTNYLTDGAVDSTLRWCSGASAGSLLLFTYVHRDVLTHPSSYTGTKNLFASLEKAGERLTFGMDPSHAPQYLAERGLSLEQDLGAAEYRARYFGAEARRMRGHEFYRVALARVGRRDTMDEDLHRMSREQLLEEVKKLRRGIRGHRDSTGHQLCWHHPALWGLLPEKTDPIPVVPDWPQFLDGCLKYRQSLDQQLPDAPRTREAYPASGSA